MSVQSDGVFICKVFHIHGQGSHIWLQGCGPAAVIREGGRLSKVRPDGCKAVFGLPWPILSNNPSGAAAIVGDNCKGGAAVSVMIDAGCDRAGGRFKETI